MRRIRARRRLRAAIILPASLCLVLFLESRIEAFVPQLKNMAVANTERMFDGKLGIAVGSLDGGIIRPITLNDVRIKNTGQTSAFPSFVVSSIKTNYRIWDIVLRFGGGSGMKGLLSSGSSVSVIFSSPDAKISGIASIESALSGQKVSGRIGFSDDKRVEFSGIVKDGVFDVLIKPDRGVIKAKGLFSEESGLTADLKIKNLRLGGYDITCDATFKNRTFASDAPSGPGITEGEFQTKNTMLNYRPFLNFSGKYRIENRLLKTGLNLGDSLRLDGSVQLKNEFETDVNLTMNNLSLGWFISSLGVKDASSVLTGTMNGKLEFKGPALSPKTVFNMEIKKGSIAGLDFELLTSTLKGDGPVMRIEDSRVTRESGYFVLAGEMDLRKIGRASLFESIRLMSDEKAIIWDGWNESNSQGVEEVRMKKRINDDINIDFKKFISDQKVGNNLREKDEVKLEYKLHSNDSLKMMVGKDKDFVGFEHKDKF